MESKSGACGVMGCSCQKAELSEIGKKSRPDLFRKGTCGAAHYVRGCQKHTPRVNKKNTSHLKQLKKNAGQLRPARFRFY
jgi:hypothetical protein